MKSNLMSIPVAPVPVRAEAIVRFAGVEKSFDGKTLVVKQLDLDVARGEFLTLLGPSGSGKTTCLMMLAGFENPTAGEILLEGRRIDHVPAYRRGIGVVFQSYALFPHMTVAENLAFPLSVRRLPRAEIAARVARALEMVRLESFAERRPSQLSGGQQQRVAVARALVFEPQLVLMDEPLGALDKQLREQLQYELKALHQRLGVTIVYVTHDQSEALALSDRIAVFHDGVIQQIDKPDALYEAPANGFVARFIGENNALAARVVRRDGRYLVAALGGGAQAFAIDAAAGTPGSPVLLSLRPERIRIGAAASGCENLFRGRVVETVYLGDHTRLRLALFDRDDFVAKLPNAEGRVAFAPGGQVDIGWRRDDCRAVEL
jgi:putative spermidine/putrescine transport system ATP-binding protein